MLISLKIGDCGLLLYLILSFAIQLVQSKYIAPSSSSHRSNKMEPLRLDLSGLSEQQVRQLDAILKGNSGRSAEVPLQQHHKPLHGYPHHAQNQQYYSPSQQSSQLNHLTANQRQHLAAFRPTSPPKSYVDLYNLHQYLPSWLGQPKPAPSPSPQFKPRPAGSSLYNLLNLKPPSSDSYQPRFQPPELADSTEFNLETLLAMEALLQRSGSATDLDFLQELLRTEDQVPVKPTSYQSPGSQRTPLSAGPAIGRYPSSFSGSLRGQVNIRPSADIRPSAVDRQTADARQSAGSQKPAVSYQELLDQLKAVKLKEVPRQSVESVVEKSQPIDLPPPQTLHSLQQDQLRHEALFGKEPVQPISESDMELLKSLGLQDNDIQQIKIMAKKKVDNPDLKIAEMLNALTEEEIETLTQMPNEDLESFAATIAKHSTEQKVEEPAKKTEIEVKPVRRKRREVKRQKVQGTDSSSGGQSASGSQSSTEQSSNSKHLSKRATYGSAASKLAELQGMVDSLDEAKQALLLEMENVKRRANAKVVRRRRRSIAEAQQMTGHSNDHVHQKSSIPRQQSYAEREKKTIFQSMGPKEMKETQGLISRMTKRKKEYEEYKRNIPDPEYSTEQIKSMADAMKTMLEKIEGMVKKEQESRKRRKRSAKSEADREGEKPTKLAGEEFSFMEFGSDNKGSYTQFQHNHKQKRSLKHLFSPGSEDVERVQPTYVVPDFVEDKQFTSGRFESHEMETPASIAAAELVSPPLRRRRRDVHVSSQSQGAAVGQGELSREKRHLEYFFPKDKPKEELVYFSVSQLKHDKPTTATKSVLHQSNK